MLHNKFAYKRQIGRIVASLLLTVIGFITMHSGVAAEEIYGRLRWRVGGNEPLVVGDVGYYLRWVNNRIEIGEYIYAKSVGEILGLEDDNQHLPDEVLVVITNNSDAPLQGSQVDIFAANIYSPNGHYIVDHFNMAENVAMRVVANPNEANWHRKGWFVMGLQSDGKLDLYTHDNAYKMVYSRAHGQRWHHLATESMARSLESYFHPLPMPKRIVPDLLLKTYDQVIMKLVTEGFAIGVNSHPTHDPAHVGLVLSQEPPRWELSQMGSNIELGVPQSVTHAMVPNVTGLGADDGANQLTALGFKWDGTVNVPTDDASLWETIESVHIFDHNGEMAELFHYEMPGETGSVLKEQLPEYIWIPDPFDDGAVQASQYQFSGLAYQDGGKVFLKKGSKFVVHRFLSPEVIANLFKKEDVTGININMQMPILEPAFYAAIMAPNGTHYVTANGDQKTLSANVTQARGWERFEIFTSDGSMITNGSQVVVRTVHGKHWTAHPGGWLGANTTKTGSWEHFTIEKVDGGFGEPFVFGDQFTLQSVHGKYVSAKSKGGGGMVANGPRIGGWEKFTLIDHPK